MPVVTVQLWQGRNLDQKRSLVAAITKAMVAHADADPAALHVILQEIPRENWARAGILGIDRKSGSRDTADHILGVSHLLLQVSDLRLAERFYVGALHFTVKERSSFSDGRPLIALNEGMGLTEGGPRPPGPVEHIAFRVTDVASYPERVESAGGRVLSGPVQGSYGMSLYFQDPDGNKLEFHSR